LDTVKALFTGEGKLGQRIGLGGGRAAGGRILLVCREAWSGTAWVGAVANCCKPSQK